MKLILKFKDIINAYNHFVMSVTNLLPNEKFVLLPDEEFCPIKVKVSFIESQVYLRGKQVI